MTSTPYERSLEIRRLRTDELKHLLNARMTEAAQKHHQDAELNDQIQRIAEELGRRDEART